MFNADNSYRIPNVIVRGHMCRTNLPANTVMRGAGSPQGLFITEHLMEKSAQALGVSSDKVLYSLCWLLMCILQTSKGSSTQCVLRLYFSYISSIFNIFKKFLHFHNYCSDLEDSCDLSKNIFFVVKIDVSMTTCRWGSDCHII